MPLHVAHIRHLMAGRGWSVIHLAAAAGIAVFTASLALSDVHASRFTTIRRLAVALGVPVAEIFLFPGSAPESMTTAASRPNDDNRRDRRVSPGKPAPAAVGDRGRIIWGEGRHGLPARPRGHNVAACPSAAAYIASSAWQPSLNRMLQPQRLRLTQVQHVPHVALDISLNQSSIYT